MWPANRDACDKMSVISANMGEVILPFEYENDCLQKVLYIPNLDYNLISTERLADNGMQSLFGRFDIRSSKEITSFYTGLVCRGEASGKYMLSEPIFHPKPYGNVSIWWL